MTASNPLGPRRVSGPANPTGPRRVIGGRSVLSGTRLVKFWTPAVPGGGGRHPNPTGRRRVMGGRSLLSGTRLVKFWPPGKRQESLRPPLRTHVWRPEAV